MRLLKQLHSVASRKRRVGRRSGGLTDDILSPQYCR
jgi:hypothetical protein